MSKFSGHGDVMSVNSPKNEGILIQNHERVEALNLGSMETSKQWTK